MRHLTAILVLCTSAPACGKKSLSSTSLTGSFVRQDEVIPGLVTRLHVTESGLAVTTPTVSVGTSGSLEVDGKPLLRGSTKAEAALGAHGSALFASVRCEEDRACAFTTKSGCEGTLTADGSGNVVLVATGECGAWSGKWIAEKDDRKVTTCPPAPPCPSAMPCPPCAPAAPTSSASAEPKRDDTGACLPACGDAQMKCTRECKVSDSACLRACSDATMECMRRCQ